MKRLPPPISQKTFLDFWMNVFKNINNRECTSVINMSVREIPYRINQLLEDKKLIKYLNKNKIEKIIPLDITLLQIEDEEDFQNLFTKYSLNNNTFYLFLIYNLDTQLIENPQLLNYLNHYFFNQHNFVFVYFFKKNISLPAINKNLINLTSYYQNIIYYPLYQTLDLEQFIYYLEIKFNNKIPYRIKTTIINNCFGYLWLVKEAVRYCQKNKSEKNIFDHEGITLRVKTIYEEFSEIEKLVLQKIVTGEKYYSLEEKLIVAYFININLIINNKSGYKLMNPLLENYLKTISRLNNQLSLNSLDQLILRNVVIDNLFSSRENKILKYCLHKRLNKIGREELADLIWGTNYQENFTDWSLDQFVRRLRKKFAAIGLINIIITNKKQGYTLDF